MIRTLVKRLPHLAAGACAAAFLAGAATAAESENDYPTEARADYIFGCMAANGQSRESLSRCSCSLDALASLLPYDKYVQASTVLSLRQGIGQRTAQFKSTKVFDDQVADLRRAQAEAEIRCYRGGT
ncbi:hypothetical protein ASG51_13295 [Methylobacterium sp. Leaf465]|jgi:hypothetical protein|uniref:hypothetical protein n=1 Tax=unclassified Methylobacterium TaxID=2615210 RepID=UPI0006F871D6|nr:hypothetical protein ASF18_16125 [Methylobacterium sp. Leaf89]KQP74583.1 hypothetical protein ASF41_17595 [Methylobacterium sp. Leaf111]KQT70451.1 hypothetical protein ASG51_13295 [Methylobacterium sp. Leaf465]KQU19093.1 hypothetical protein ASG63_08110 [Methylobacterium sp. Leaf94]